MRASKLPLFLAALPLASCLADPHTQSIWDRTPGAGEVFMTNEEKAAKDDAICKGYGVEPGTPTYIQCRMTQDQRRDVNRNAPIEPLPGQRRQ